MRILILIFCFLTFTSFVNDGLSDESVSNKLRSMSKELNKSLPVRVDREKILETTMAVKNVLVMKYKITDDSTFKDPRFDVNLYVYHFRNGQGQFICKDESNFELLKRGASYNYIFVNKYGQKLFEYTLNEQECLNYLSGRK